jgi:chaperonin GroES
MSKITFKPTGINILIKKSTPKGKSKGGIILPEVSGQDTPVQAEVVAVGKGGFNVDGSRRELDVKVGDIVVVEAFTGTKVNIDEQEYLLINENNVLGVY